MEEKEKEKKTDNKSNKLIVVIVILSLIIVGMGVYIAYDKGVIFSSVENDTKQSNDNKELEETKEEQKNDSDDSNKIKPLDLSKCLNSSSGTYQNSSDVEGNYGLSMSINQDQKSITLSIDWSKFGPLSNASSYASTVENYQITGFSKSISSVFVGDYGQDSTGITLFYVMSDGTVEYTPIFALKQDSQGNSYYEMNYTYDYSSDGRVTGQHFATKGIINGVTDVIKLYTADYSIPNGSGLRTTIGARKDGSFYDLGKLIQK